jgi:GNAT superfamily N-acetyltransferase
MYIDYIAIRSDYRGQGIGSVLITKLISMCYAENQSIHLYPERSEVQPWYLRHGFYETYGGFFNLHYYNTRRARRR